MLSTLRALLVITALGDLDAFARVEYLTQTDVFWR
jgi:hypothetical protein